MPKNLNIIFLFIISISLFPLFISENDNSTNNKEVNEVQDNNGMNEDNKNKTNPLDTYNYTNVFYLDDTNSTQELSKHNTTYILFYSYLCKYCQYFMSLYIETANYCKENNLSVVFTRIEMELSPNTSEEYSITEYPTIILLTNGRRFRFGGLRNKTGLLYFLDKKLNDDIYKINRLEEIKEYTNRNGLVFLSTIKDKSSNISKLFKEYASSSYYNYFLSCLSEECLKKYGEDIILFKKFDEKENSYSKDFGKLSEAKENSLYEFRATFGIEAGVFLDLVQLNLLIEYERKAVIYVRDSANEELVKYDKLFKQLGKELRFDKIYTYVSDNGNISETNIEEAFCILPEEYPGIFYYNQDTGDPSAPIKLFSKRGLDMKQVDLQYLRKFVNDCKNENFRRDLFSEHPSKSVMINGLRYVVGKTFDKYVTDEKRNVFLGIMGNYERQDEEQLFLEILTNLTKKYEDISFCYINIQSNEPRDLNLSEETLPIGFLYTNAMKEKKIIKFKPNNITNLQEKEFEIFLDENVKGVKNENNKEIGEIKKETDL